MKSAHAGILAAAGLLIAASVWGGFVLFDPLQSGSQEQAATPQLVPPRAEPGAAAGDALEEVAAGSDRAALPSALPQGTSAETDAVVPPSRLLARVLDTTGRPIPNARLDAPQRPELGSATGDSSGHVVLVTARENVRLWNGQAVSRVFRISAEGHATRFLRAAMQRDTDVDLGDLVLGPGGDVVGRVVDAAGAPMADVQVTAGEAALGRPGNEARLTGPVSEEGRIETTTAADGSYRLTGVAAGPGRIWAHAEGLPWEFTPALEVAAATDTRAPDLVLAGSDPSHRISGVVLDPNEDPVAGAVVLVAAFVDGPVRSVRVETDSDGKFQVVAVNDVSHALEAFHPTAALRPTYLDMIRPGTADIELRLGELQWVLLKLVDDSDGKLIEKPWVRLDGHQQLEHATDVPRPKRETLGPGLVRAPIPQGRFNIRASAPAYAYKSEGPFTAETIPADYEIRLKGIPMVRGRVLADGRPVVGARVQTVRAITDKFPMVTQGFRTRLFVSGAFAAETDEEGRFEQPISLSVPEGDHVLHVSKEGWANSEQVIDVPDEGLDGVEVVLTRGGTIEGHVLLGGGRDPRGALVAASNGDGSVLTARADAEGLYRLEHLAPGPWELRFREEDEEFIMGFAGKPHEGPYEGDCVVFEGRTTRYDIDTRADAATIEGRLRIDGQPAKGWTARLEREKAFGIEKLGTSVVLDDSGAYVIESDSSATRLILETLGTSETFTSLIRMFDPSTTAGFDLEFNTGRLTGSAPANSRLKAYVKLPGNWHYHVTLNADAAGRIAVTLPAGRVEISTAEIAGGGFKRWKPGLQVELPVGGEQAVEIE